MKTNARRSSRRPGKTEILCLTHLRWDRADARLCQLMTRFARQQRVFIMEEPIFEGDTTSLHVRDGGAGILVATPWLPLGMRGAEATVAQRRLLDAWLDEHALQDFVAWYDTPMALAFTEHLEPRLVVYDCADELSACQGAARSLRRREAEMMARAHVVLTAGPAFYESKKERHPSVHWVADGADVARFARARRMQSEPEDQAAIPHPRLGYFGPLDERLDRALVEGVASARPEWQLVLIGAPPGAGPVSVRPNVHCLGPKDERELPAYVAGWDVAILPFAQSRATRFVRPAQPAELLAAGRSIVATPVPDVVKPYAELGLVEVASGMRAFVAAVEHALGEATRDAGWRRKVDGFLAGMSWDQTWARASAIVDAALADRQDATRRTVDTAVSA
jgi:UDP-galactopyranose mutase